MLSITDCVTLTHALRSALDARIKELLRIRRDQLGGDITDNARFIILEPPDTLETLEAELGFELTGAQAMVFAPEWIADHDGVLEAVWILTDSGFAHVAILPEVPAMDQRLTEIFRSFGSPRV